MRFYIVSRNEAGFYLCYAGLLLVMFKWRRNFDEARARIFGHRE